MLEFWTSKTINKVSSQHTRATQYTELAKKSLPIVGILWHTFNFELTGYGQIMAEASSGQVTSY